MKIVYTPKGRAREYSPLALNVYTQGCDHGCKYCYCAGFSRWGTDAKPRNLAGLARDAEKADQQILLSFMSDPYHLANNIHKNTREALLILREHGCSVAILTKGGTRSLQDIDIFANWPDGRIKVGATLTFGNDHDSLKEEPGAALPSDRLKALQELHAAGVKTWASIEPVIDPRQSLDMIHKALPYCMAYKVGTLNHDKRSHGINWTIFGTEAVDMIRQAGRKVYVKHDLRPHLPSDFLTEAEVDMNALNVPPRPRQQKRIKSSMS